MILIVTLAITATFICTSTMYAYIGVCNYIIFYYLLPGMLLWFCQESIIQEIVQGGNTTISQSGLLPEISEEVIDAPSITNIKRFFTVDAWMTLVQKGAYDK